MVGLERFELSSIAPEATSLDQASRQPLLPVCSLSSLRRHKIVSLTFKFLAVKIWVSKLMWHLMWEPEFLFNCRS